jgi:hypothetical protein
MDWRRRKNVANCWRNYLVRGAALFFLLHAGADLLLPQYFCSEDCGGIRVADSSLTQAGAVPEVLAEAAVTDIENPSRETPSDQAPHEDDCFCCGASLLVSGVHGRLELLELTTLTHIDDLRSIPYPPVTEMFRPPRLG